MANADFSLDLNSCLQSFSFIIFICWPVAPGWDGLLAYKKF